MNLVDKKAVIFGMVRDGGKISFLKYNLNELAKKTCTLWHTGEDMKSIWSLLHHNSSILAKEYMTRNNTSIPYPSPEY